MAIDKGMNIAEVKALAEQLKAAASKFDGIVQLLNSKVSSTTWVGADATKFKNDWWPGHRMRLQSLRADLEGFGQSAHNNATEQETASAVGGGVGIGTMVGVVGIGGAAAGAVGGNPPSGARPSGAQPPTPSLNQELSRSEKDLRDSFLKEWKQKPNSPYDQWNFLYDGDGDANPGNCTSYVAWRLNQLAEAQGLGGNYFSNNHLGDMTGLRFGDAGSWGSQATQLGRPPDMTPTPGSVAWFSYGHVAVVQSVNSDGSIVIEQSSWDDYSLNIATLHPGDSGYPTGFLHLLP